MRLFGLLVSVLLLTGISAAQDTNFPVGPQYLVTSGSPQFARPIATPSLSLGESLPQISGSVASEAPSATEMPSPSAHASTQIFLSTVFWGEHSVPDILGRVVATPSLSLSQPAAPTTAASEQGTTRATVSEIEITSASPHLPLPASLFDAGVTGMTDADSLRIRGYGIPLGDTASFWKSQKLRAPRIYTNRDLERFHSK